MRKRKLKTRICTIPGCKNTFKCVKGSIRDKCEMHTKNYHKLIHKGNKMKYVKKIKGGKCGE